jgi:AcrR family transcriptional regulator
VPRTQEERRAETRRRLLEAAATRFAEQGIEGTSVDAIADAADRTSGALYDHFGSKEGLLTALLESWTNDVAAVIAAELVVAESLDAQLLALWRNFVDPPAEDGGRWVQLEHELWLYAARNGRVRERLADRYRDVWDRLGEAVQTWADTGQADPVVPPANAAPLLIAMLIGLEMQHRVDPGAVTDEMAVAGLRALLGLSTKE